VSVRVAALAVLAVLASCSTSADRVEPGERVVIWPGYSFEFPAGHCARRFSPADDFDVYRIRAKQPPDAPLLVGIYAGFAPDFPEDPTAQTSTVNGLAVRSIRNADGRWEFLIEDAAPDSKGGVLHIWFGPGADADSRVAERLVRSVQPAAMPPADAPGPPSCD